MGRLKVKVKGCARRRRQHHLGSSGQAPGNRNAHPRRTADAGKEVEDEAIPQKYAHLRNGPLGIPSCFFPARHVRCRLVRGRHTAAELQAIPHLPSELLQAAFLPSSNAPTLTSPSSDWMGDGLVRRNGDSLVASGQPSPSLHAISPPAQLPTGFVRI